MADGLETNVQDKQLLAQAKELTSVGRAVDAFQLYEHLFIAKEGTQSDEHPEKYECMEGLADTCIALKEFGEAGRLFERLLDACKTRFGSQSKEAAGILYKLAQCHEQFGRAESAAELYEQCLQLLEQTEPRGALRAQVMEAYAWLLRGTGKDPLKADRLKEEAARIKEDTRIKESARIKEGGLQAETPKGKRSTTEGARALRQLVSSAHADSAERATKRSQLRGLKQHTSRSGLRALPHVFIQIVQVFLACLTLVVLAVAYFQHQSATTQSTQLHAFQALPHPTYPIVYRTIDGARSISVCDEHTLEWTSNGKRTQVPFEYINATDPRIHDFFEVGEGLRDRQGTCYYQADAPELQLAAKMKASADNAARVFKATGHYPQTVKELIGSTADSASSVAPDANIVILLREQTPSRHEAPDRIECYVRPATGKNPAEFSVFSFDRRGNILQGASGKPFSYRVLAGKLANQEVVPKSQPKTPALIRQF